jgi:hypothetical protein
VGSTVPGKASVMRRTLAYCPSQSWLRAWLTHHTGSPGHRRQGLRTYGSSSRWNGSIREGARRDNQGCSLAHMSRQPVQIRRQGAITSARSARAARMSPCMVHAVEARVSKETCSGPLFYPPMVEESPISLTIYSRMHYVFPSFQDSFEIALPVEHDRHRDRPGAPQRL